jgi:hypothetical protein
MPTYILRSDAQFLQFDATSRVGFGHSAAVTAHPIEDGSEVSDHVQRLPSVITVDGIVSASQREGNVGADDPAREQTAKAFLEGCWGQQVIIVTQRFGAFAGYTLRRWTDFIDVVKRTAFSLEFVKIETATTTTVVIESSTPQVASGFTEAADVGEQSTTSTDTSTLYSMFGG